MRKFFGSLLLLSTLLLAGARIVSGPVQDDPAPAPLCPPFCGR
jgi:hypothetical protein